MPGRYATRRRINVGLTLVQRLRRWTNVEPTLIRPIVSAGREYRMYSGPSRTIFATIHFYGDLWYLAISPMTAIMWTVIPNLQTCADVHVNPIARRLV